MNFDQHMQTRTGKTVDTDGVYPNQCMDLMHQYLIDVFAFTDPHILSAPSARLVYENFDSIYGHEMFDRVANTPINVPEKGDIVVFGQPFGYDPETGIYHGHVCIFIDGDINKFRSFDANFVTALPHIQQHTYAGALGWLRVRKDTSELFLGKPKAYWLQVEKDRADLMKQVEDKNTEMVNRSEAFRKNVIDNVKNLKF